MSDLLDLRTVNATWHLGPHAEVRVGDHVTRYVRRGSGPCVVLLGANTECQPFWGPLVEALMARFRLVVPEMRAAGGGSPEWLRGFFEGLGITSVSIIAGAEAARTAIDVANADEFTVGRLIVLADAGVSTPRILFVDPSASPEEAVERITEFLTRARG